MPAETFKERMQLVAGEFGEDLILYGYNRDALGDGAMPPFNTEEGEKWLWREIEAVKPDIIVFDSIMCLLAGQMSEEESWAPVKLLMRRISGRRIGQIWLHHTGHDTSKGFGTKTREWEMDTVVALTTADQNILMEFKKARLRTPKTAEHFRPRTIARDETGWIVVGEGQAKTANKSDIDILKHAIMDAYDRLADGRPTSSGLNGAPVVKVSANEVRDEVKRRGFLETNDNGFVTAPSRNQFMRARRALISGPKPRLAQDGDLIWRP
jgi:hypothetical protein